MILIPATRLDRGTPEHVLDQIAAVQHYSRDWFEDEAPVSFVDVAAFWIDRTPVTNAAYAQFVADTGYQTVAERRGFSLVYLDGYWAELPGTAWHSPSGPASTVADRPDHPVVQVAYADAAAYAEWAGKRLPTEAEWELAARGPSYRMWPWGDTWDRSKSVTAEYWAEGPSITDNSHWRVWWDQWRSKFDGNPLPGTVPVGSIPDGASPYGVTDMAGNVQEWTSTVYRMYDPEATYDPIYRFLDGKYQVVRGGCWMNFRHQVRCAERVAVDPLGFTNFSIGFRCARNT